MAAGFHHVSLKCASREELEKAKAFYCGLLGLRVAREWPEGVMIGAGGASIEIFCNGEGVKALGAIRHLALCVDDVDASAELVRRAGYTVFVGPKDIVQESVPPFRARVAFCTGPLGEQVELLRVKDPGEKEEEQA